MRDWYFIAERPALAPHLAHPEECAALRIVLVTHPLQPLPARERAGTSQLLRHLLSLSLSHTHALSLSHTHTLTFSWAAPRILPPEGRRVSRNARNQ